MKYTASQGTNVAEFQVSYANVLILPDNGVHPIPISGKCCGPLKTEVFPFFINTVPAATRLLPSAL